MKTQKFKFKLLPILTISSISIVFISCMKTSTIKSKENAKEITYLISTIKTNKKVEIVNYKSDSKNGELIREKLNGLETKTFHLKTKINTKRKNILYIFEKQ